MIKSAVARLAFATTATVLLVVMSSATAHASGQGHQTRDDVAVTTEECDVDVNASLVSQRRSPVTVSVTCPNVSAGDLVGLPVTVRVTGIPPITATLNSSGVGTAWVTVWKSASLQATFAPNADFVAASSPALRVVATPPGVTVRTPPGAPNPRPLIGPAPGPAVGGGANPTVYRIPAAMKRTMIGRTWAPGCVAFAALRAIDVNYYGFDGYRYRGTIVVRADVAPRVRGIFARLYSVKYPIRSIVPQDRFGRNPKGPGANDYASMMADNTSGFNCRYVVGREAQRVWSPHSSGRAIDINTWENPYGSPTGTYPNTWFMSHRPASHPAVLTQSSAAVRIFRAFGYTWGGQWGPPDYQHFQRMLGRGLLDPSREAPTFAFE